MNIYEQYAKLERLKKEIELEQAEVKEKILQEIPEEGYKGDFGTFSFQVRKKWSYSADVKLLEGKLKDQKKLEEKEGTAVCEDNKILYFKASK